MNVEEARARLWPKADSAEPVVVEKRKLSTLEKLLKRQKKQRKKRRMNAVPQVVWADSVAHPMAAGDETMKIAKAAQEAVETGATEIPREAFYSAMMERAAKKRQDGETAEKALSRLLLAKDAKTEALFRAQRVAKATSAAHAPAAVTKSAPAGPANARIQKLADAYLNGQTALGKRCTAEQAFTAIYTSPEHVALRDAAKAEEMRRAG